MKDGLKVWKRGLPPGEYYEGMFDDFEVVFTIGGFKWHKRRTSEEREQWIERKAAIARHNARVSERVK
jgi:hypothetical protein